ncbi:hypothetical protein [Janthinobacterium svalbardensis]|uniref:hypothetical protein n=1 Tax=Janthinobacterium svalbardensis TaxID=368607 RepID=UPI00142D5F8F|nr:hypothetical protein [Janthinobacterium svalbardensis]
MMTGQQLSRFDIAELVSETPKALGAKTSTFSGITRKFFNEYFEGRQLAQAFKVTSLYTSPYRCPVGVKTRLYSRI